MAAVAYGPFRVSFGNTVKGRDPANPQQDKTVCQAYGYDSQEANRMAHAICEALNEFTRVETLWPDAELPKATFIVDGIQDET